MRQETARADLVFLGVFNLTSALFAVVGNVLVLLAIRRSRLLHPPSKALLFCLGVTDFLTGVVVQPTFSVVLFIKAQGIRVVEALETVVSLPAFAGSFISLCVVTTIAIDRLLAFHLAQRYRHVVTLKRMVTLLVIFTIFGTVSELLWVFYPDVCLVYWFVVLSMSILISSFAFVKVYVKLRHLQSQVQVQGGHNSNGHFARYRKSVKNMLAVYILFIVTYTPHWCVIGAVNQAGGPEPAFRIAIIISSTVLYLNSSLNPLIYCWRIREIRQNVLQSLSSIRSLPCGCKS